MEFLDQAIADFDRAIELDPNQSWAHYFRGLAYHELGGFSQSSADLKKAIELDLERLTSCLSAA